MSIKDNEIAMMTLAQKARLELKVEKVMAFGGFIMTLSILALGLYMVIGKSRLEIVYLNNDRLDAPTVLPKLRTDASEVQVDRWIRGFVRRVVGYAFVHEDDSDDFAEKSARWMFSHLSSDARGKYEAILSDINGYNKERRKSYVSFYPVNNTAAVKIRRSGVDASRFFVEIPGTYVINKEKAEAFFDSKLKLVVKEGALSGIPDSYGGLNTTGLVVEGGTVEFVEDASRPEEVTRVDLFGFAH